MTASGTASLHAHRRDRREPLTWFTNQGHRYEDGLDLLAFGVDLRVAHRYLSNGGTPRRAIELVAAGMDLSRAADALEMGVSHRELLLVGRAS